MGFSPLVLKPVEEIIRSACDEGRATLCLNASVRHRLMRQTCSLGDWLR
jgi:hypothetical protein